MPYQKGFVWLPLLLAILGVLAVSGGAYWYVHKQSSALQQSIYPPVATTTVQTSATTSVNNTYSSQSVSSTLPPSLSTPTSYNPYGCYEQIDNSVALGSSTDLLPGADLQSFVDLSQSAQSPACFGKDKNHVYYYDQVWPWADPATFSVLWYGGRAMFLGNGTEIVAGSRELGYSPGPSSTSALAGPSGPMQFYIVPNGDPKTFEAIFGAYDRALWAKDKNNVYCEGMIIEGANPSTVMLVDSDQKLSVVVAGVRKTFSACNTVSNQ